MLGYRGRVSSLTFADLGNDLTPLRFLALLSPSCSECNLRMTGEKMGQTHELGSTHALCADLRGILVCRVSRSAVVRVGVWGIGLR